jgi:general L-amino acid transport system substrate-binding protein
MKYKCISAIVVLMIVLGFFPFVQAGTTLEAVKQRGYVIVGCNTGQPGFSSPDSAGAWRGLDIDYGRALAAALFGDATKVKFVPLSSTQRFTALQSGEIDILARNTTHTLLRDAQLGVNFTSPIFYDGTGFLVHKKLGVKSALELNGASICYTPGSTTEMNVAEFFLKNKMTYKPVLFDSNEEVTKAFVGGRCDSTSGDRSSVAGTRITTPTPENFVVLPEIISKEPLAPAVRHGDDQWYDVACWVLYAMITGEELGITSKNVDSFLTSTNPEIKRFLGLDGGLGKALGLNDKWAYNIIIQVGNYSESYEANLGENTPMKLQRGVNALWNKGGLLYAPPFK